MVINVPKLHTLSEPRFRALLTEGGTRVLFHREAFDPLVGSLFLDRMQVVVA